MDPRGRLPNRPHTTWPRDTSGAEIAFTSLILVEFFCIHFQDLTIEAELRQKLCSSSDRDYRDTAVAFR
jgi:hypothetical protein